MRETIANLGSIFVDMGISHSTEHRRDFSVETHEYMVSGGRTMRLDLYRPHGSPGAAPPPVLIYAHGGGWKIGSRRMIPPLFFHQVARGFALASVSYSLSHRAKWPVQFLEMKTAVRWLRRNAGRLAIDPECFIVCGVSAGGHLANLIGATNATDRCLKDADLGVVSADVQGVASLFGLTDLTEFYAQSRLHRFVINDIIGAGGAKALSLLNDLNPIVQVHRASAPHFLMYGGADVLTPSCHGERLQDALLRQGVYADFVCMPGYRHGDRRFNGGEARRRLETFIDQVARR